MLFNYSINSELSGRTYFITLPTVLRNSTWANYWGSIQKDLRSLPSEAEYVVINAQKLEWVDPFPMLSLLIGIAEIHTEKKVFYVISEDCVISDKQKQVIEFLEKEGFFLVMKQYGIKIIDSSVSDEIYKEEESFQEREKVLFEKIKEYNGFLSFRDSTILKAKVVDLAPFKGENQIHNLVESELADAKHWIRQHLPISLMNEIVWKTGLFLKETINNVYEHAYEGYSQKYVGYFIRHRYGLMDNTIDSATRKEYDSLFDYERIDVRCFEKEFPLRTNSFLEVYVIDAGIGLTEHYTSRAKNSAKKKSLKEVWRETVGDGNRSTKNKKNTKFGGLYTLSRLLNNDYLVARDYDCWTGSVLPVKKRNDFYVLAKDNHNGSDVQGLALMCRIAMKKAMDNNVWSLTEQTGKCFQQAMKEEKSVYEKYFNCSYRQLKHPLSHIRDERVKTSFISRYLGQENGVEFCVFLPKENISKNLIHSTIESFASSLKSGVKSKSVIIADIPVNECGLYQFALENASFGVHFTKMIERIVLISQRLSVYVLLRNKDDKYVFSEHETSAFIGSSDTQPSVFAPHRSLLHAIEWLKTHDSMLVWQYIKSKNREERFYVSQPVTWYKGKDETQLQGYLDFEKTLTDALLRRMYQNALHRTLCLSSESKCEYEPNDPLMTSLADYMNTLYYNRRQDHDNVLIPLCSVYVSGNTQNGDAVNSINMFLHKDSNHYTTPNSIMHLFAWPSNDLFIKENSGTNNHYTRVGSTYAIAPFGWRYFPVPRYKALDPQGSKISANKYFFDKSSSKQEFKSIYKCPPKDTYAYWQGKNGLFMGISHVEYESKHDILNFNIPFIVKESFLLGGDLACFLLGEIVTLLDVKIEDLQFNHDDIKFKDDVSNYIHDRRKGNPRVCSLLVYPYHSNTEQVIEIIKEYLPENQKKNIVPLIPINKERNGISFQPSPLTLEMLRKKIDDALNIRGVQEDVNALFFDDSIVDGKTQDEIKQIMYGLGIRHVVSMFILERRRIPFNTSDDKRVSAFWRLDIPRLGTKQNCPLCAVLNTIEDFSNQLISDQAIDRVRRWKEIWGGRTEITLDRIQTIDPRVIHLRNPHKRFGIYFDGDEYKQCGGDDQRIELINSWGLTLYMGELLGITSRDDKMLQYCSDEYGLDDFTVLEMLCTNLLLYGRTISNKVRKQITEEVFHRANNFRGYNNHTALAALVLMTQEKEVLNVIKDMYDTMRKSNIQPNYDMLILLSYLGMHYKREFGEYEEPKKLWQSVISREGAYRLFHSELLNGNGKDHDRPLKRLMDGLISTSQELDRVVDALDCVLYALKYVYDWSLTKWGQNDTSSNTIIENTREEINKMKALDKALFFDQEKKDYQTKYIHDMKTLNKLLLEIHSRLFMPLNLMGARKDLDDNFVLYERISEWARSGKYDLEFVRFRRYDVELSQIYEKWVIWDQYVDEEIEYLLNNANEYSSGPFLMSGAEVSKGAHKVWVSVEYDLKKATMSLLLYNMSSNNSNYIMSETAKKTRYGKSYLTEEMKVRVLYCDIPGGIIETRIEFQLL